MIEVLPNLDFNDTDSLVTISPFLFGTKLLTVTSVVASTPLLDEGFTWIAACSVGLKMNLRPLGVAWAWD